MIGSRWPCSCYFVGCCLQDFFNIVRVQCFVHLIWMVLEMIGCRLYSCCFVGYCPQDLCNTLRNILVQLPSSYFSLYALSVSMWCIYIVEVTRLLLWKKLRFILIYYYKHQMEAWLAWRLLFWKRNRRQSSNHRWDCCVSLCANPLGKAMDPIVLSPVKVSSKKYWIL